MRLLNLPVSTGTAEEPGLILIQVDGLSRHELERALKRGRMPFLRKLRDREFYSVHTMYPGQPTTTPAVLGELFYGVEQAVPAFGFRDHRTGAVVQMFQPGIASRIQNELAEQGEGLLSGGVAYCDIYCGGADDSSFCPATTGWRNLEDAAMWRRIALVLLNAMSVVRIVVLAMAELVVAFSDFVRGVNHGHRWWQELLFVPRRVVVSIVLRELVTISAEADVTRGVPVIHANFLGYDEHAHRRGPDALFAHYALRGTDRAIQRIWDAAHDSRRRNYHVWIMSDHGQEHVVPYSTRFGKPVSAAVNEIFDHSPTDETRGDRPGREDADEEVRNDTQRSRWLRRSNSEANGEPHTHSRQNLQPLTVAIGPLGYIYWPTELTGDEIDGIARRLVEEAHIPLVMARVGEDVRAWNADGSFRLLDEKERVLGTEHPFLDYVAADFARLCDHPDAGDFVISGWSRDGESYSFVTENGAHGGPGPRETQGFVMLPADAPSPESLPQPFRPKSLRGISMAVLQRGTLPSQARPTQPRSVRIATYNVHSCVGLDGRLSPARIARVLAGARPDIVALQELDVERLRTEFVDQARQIAKALEMELHFHPAFRVEEEQYGDAILSRFPMKLIKAGSLAGGRPRSEPRGALWVEIAVGGHRLQVINTHLGLAAAERREQVAELLGENWLEEAERRGPVIFCGDLNSGPRSRMYRDLQQRFRDAQVDCEGHRPRRTWFSTFPLTRIDHIFISPQLKAGTVHVPRTRLSRMASDHLPLIVELELPAADSTELPGAIAEPQSVGIVE